MGDSYFGGLLGQLTSACDQAYQNAFGNIGNLICTGTTSNITGGTLYFGGGLQQQEAMPNPAVKREPTEIEWLKSRVEEMCWREAA